jgi:hypothetical protein
MFRKAIRYSLLSALSLAMTQLPSFAYQLDKTNRVINVAPGTSVSATTTDIQNAFSYLVNRADKTALWTMKFAPGKYVVSKTLRATGLKNTILTSNPSSPAKIVKTSTWDDNTSGEYLLNFPFANNVQLLGFELYGHTSFANGNTPDWGDQGVYFGSGNIVKVDSNKFYNFGNAALRVVTDARDPVPGVNSFRTQVSNNLFNNIYQTATTSIDKIHGGTAISTWTKNTFVNLRGSIKFASRTPGAKTIEFSNNVVNGGDHFGLEIDNYSDFTIKGNTFQNIKEYAMTIYTNGSGELMKSGFPWGDNFSIVGNTIKNVAYAIRYAHKPFWDGTQNIPKNLVIDGNTISNVTNTTSYVPLIYVGGGVFNGVKITNNKMSAIANKKYFSVQSGSTNVSILNNMVDGVAYGAQTTTASK